MDFANWLGVKISPTLPQAMLSLHQIARWLRSQAEMCDRWRLQTKCVFFELFSILFYQCQTRPYRRTCRSTTHVRAKVCAGCKNCNQCEVFTDGTQTSDTSLAPSLAQFPRSSFFTLLTACFARTSAWFRKSNAWMDMRISSRESNYSCLKSLEQH